ncbi:scaffolding protein [Mycobacterium phage Taquito]|uniref:Scaffolding protein n=1 Tax=Mycobacterium phage Taquito TaxID=1897500 RepID=A0A1D8EQ12_9CAUD|nr:head scaffolding protein [Mycobacterium phage Taquito]AOT23132.1 scaffolding protein [Mycobacterium phage Taquito]
MPDDNLIPDAGGDADTAGADNENTGGATDAGKNDEALGEGGEKALKAEREARRKAERDLAAARAELQKIEDAKKSELQKALERAQEAEKRAEQAELAALRQKIANREGKKVPVSALTGTTEEELTAQADALIEWRDQNGKSAEKQTEKKRTPPPPGGGSLKSGASGNGNTNSDPKARAAEALKRLRQSG